jgi:hypothetical protein
MIARTKRYNRLNVENAVVVIGQHQVKSIVQSRGRSHELSQTMIITQIKKYTGTRLIRA